LDSASDQNSSRRVSLIILGAAAFMVASDARVVDQLLNTIKDDFKVPLSAAAYVVSAYALPYSLGQLIYGPLGDRIGKVRVMAIGFTCFACGTAACGLVPQGMGGLYLLIALRFITGVFAASIIPLSIAYIGDKFAPEKRQAMLGQFMSALMLGSVLSGPIGGACGQYLTWRAVFLVLGGLSMLVMIAYWKAALHERAPVHDPSKPRTPVVKGYLNVLANPNSKVVFPAIFLEGFFLFGGFVYLATSLQNIFQLKLLQAGMLISFYGLGGLTYSFTAKKILKNLKQWQMAALGGTLLMCGFLIAAALRKPFWWPVIPGALMIGFGFNSLHSTLQTKATELAPKARGTAVSLFAFFFFLGQSLGVQAGAQLGTALGSTNPDDGKFYPIFWGTFIAAGIGLFLTAMWVASRLPKMAQEQVPAAPAFSGAPQTAVAASK